MTKPVGHPQPKVLFIGEAPGDQEELKGIPLVGASGDEMIRLLTEVDMLPSHQASLIRPKKYSCGDMFLHPSPPAPYAFTNVCRVQPFRNQIDQFFRNKTTARKEGLSELMGLYPTKEIRDGLTLLRQEIQNYQPNLIVAMGNTALWAVTGLTKRPSPGPTGIMSYRGSQLESYLLSDAGRPFPVVPILHPASIFRVWSNRYLILHDLRTRVKPYIDTPWVPPNYDFITRPSYREAFALLTDMMAKLARGPLYIAADIETRLNKYIECIALADSAQRAFCIPFMVATDAAGYWSPREETHLVHLLCRILSHPNARIIGQNWEYDRQFGVRNWFTKFNLFHDTMTRHHTVFPGLPKGLDFLSSFYCAFHRYWKDDAKEMEKTIDEDLRWEYNCTDAVITYEVDKELDSVIAAMGLTAQAEFQMALHEPVFDMIHTGVRIDVRARDDIANSLIDAMLERSGWLQHVVGYNVESKSDKPWYNSPQQTATLLYKWLNIRPILDRRTRRPTTSSKVFPDIIAREPLVKPLLDSLDEYRSLGVFLRTYCRARLRAGRMHTQFNVAGTETFRWSSALTAFREGANLQNISKGDEE